MKLVPVDGNRGAEFRDLSGVFSKLCVRENSVLDLYQDVMGRVKRKFVGYFLIIRIRLKFAGDE